MPRRLPPLTRRTTLGATLVVLVAAAGCDLDDLDPRSEPAPPDEAAPPAPPEGDALLVESVVVDLLALQVAIGQVRAGQRARFRPLARLHRRHLAELDGAAGGEGATSAAPTSVVGAASILRSEQRLQRRLATAAIEAESGELAVVLASMSAAVAQQLAVLAAASEAR